MTDQQKLEMLLSNTYILHEWVPDNKLVTKTYVLKKHNWTPGLLNKYYMVPEYIKLYNRYKSNQLISLYNIIKVMDIENSQDFKVDFKKLQNKRNILSRRMTLINNDRRQRTLDLIETFNLEVPIYNDHVQMYEDAIDAYNNWHIDNPYKRILHIRNFFNKDDPFLKRITVNMLRHHVCKYHKMIKNLKGKVGKDVAYERLKYKINKEIYRYYPFLKTN